jgi:lysophospholipase L1-like esterase
MRPYRSFLLLLIFLTCFAGLYFILPGYIRLPGINDFIPKNITEGLTKRNQTPYRLDTITSQTINKPIPDTVQIPFPDSVNISHHISAPLEKVIDSLQSSKGQIRILYYGDSQIEGDRITSWLRQTLRKGKEGTGPGLFLPQMPVMYTRSISVRSSSNWKRYNYISFKNKEIGNNDFGPLMTICRYLSPGTKSAEIVKASVRIVPSVFADSAVAEFDKLRIFYKNDQGTVNIKVSGGDKLIFQDTMNISGDIKELAVKLNKPEVLHIEFEGYVSPDIFGMSIEGEKGVVVDNIAQRGSAGMEFTMVGKGTLKRLYEKLQPDLFILNYGLNIVRNIRDDYSYYENGLLRQLKLIKEICPETPVLVIGLSDMAFRDRDSIKSFPNIPKIRDAQKHAAEKAGAAFWDSYEAMGGEYSSVIWSEKKPQLMQKDYVHFTFMGADTISKMLYQAMFTHASTDSILPVAIHPGKICSRMKLY